MAKILVTGGTGFLGKYVIRELLKDQENEVVVFSLDDDSMDGVVCIKIDLSDYKDLMDKIENLDFDIVYHLAGSVPLPGKDTFQRHHAGNTLATFNVLRACRSKDINHIVYISTVEVYGDDNREKEITENHPREPSNPYAESKVAAENYCRIFSKEEGMRVTVIRPTYIYGFGQHKERLFPKLIEAALGYQGVGQQEGQHKGQHEGQQDLTPSVGGNDYIYVKDAARGIVFLGSRDQQKNLEFFNLSSGRFTSNLEIFNSVNEITGYGRTWKEEDIGIDQDRNGQTNAQENDGRSFCFDVSKAKECGFEVKYSSSEGLKDMISCYEKEMLSKAGVTNEAEISGEEATGKETTSKKKILFTAFHPGSSNSIVPVIKSLRDEGNLLNQQDLEIVVIGYMFSEKVFENAGISFKRLEDYGPDKLIGSTQPTKETMLKILNVEKPDLVVTGASIQNPKYRLLIEHSVTAAAKEMGIRTLAIMDMWRCYKERFSDQFSGRYPDECLQFLPDDIAVIDQLAKEEMIAEGFVPEKLHVTGNPHFDDLGVLKDSSETEIEKVKADLGINPNNKIIMFVTQPIKGHFGTIYGYDQETGLLDLIDGMRKVHEMKTQGNQQNGSLPNFSLLVKVHPRDLELDYRQLTNSLPFEVVVDSDYDTRKCILASDVVVGAFSTVLVEARYMDKVAISLQPGLRQKSIEEGVKEKDMDLLITNELGITYPVYEYNSVWQVLQDALINPDALALNEISNDGLATERVKSLISDILNSGNSETNDLNITSDNIINDNAANDNTAKARAANNGGWKVPLFNTYWDEGDIEAVSKVIKRGTYWATGPEIDEFEKQIASFVGSKYALSFNSGTSALHAMLLAHDVKGKEIIVPSFTFIATANAVLLAGGIPVFAEVEEETFALEYEDVKNKITNNTMAIMPVHYGGCAARDIIKIRNLCREKDILLLEEAAESLGASVNGENVGTFGDAAMFSFCQNKVISCGEGGIVVTNDQKIFERMKLTRNHGRFEIEGTDYFSSTEDSDYLEIGSNFRMPTMSAALGLSQLSKIDLVKGRRQETAARITAELSSLPGVKLPIPPFSFGHVYQMYTIILETNKLRGNLQQHLKDAGIMTKVYFNPIHLKTFYTRKFGYKEGDLPKTENLSKRVLTLPMSASFPDEQVDYIIKSIKDYFAASGRK